MQVVALHSGMQPEISFEGLRDSSLRVMVGKEVCFINQQRNDDMSLTWLLGAFLAFVKAPGGPHCPTAVLLLGKARERFAALQ